MAPPETEGQQRLLDHLPDVSEELAASADLAITLDGCQLPLHSAVLAAGSRVLRQALVGAASGGGAASQAAAVQQAFERHPLPDVLLCLKLLYSGSAAADSTGEARDLTGVVALADKLDAAAVLQASMRSTCGCWCTPTAGDWASWLALADRHGLRRLKPIAAEASLRSLFQGTGWKAELEKMSGLSASTYQLLFEAAVATIRSMHAQHPGIARHGVAGHMPTDFSRWAQAGDLLEGYAWAEDKAENLLRDLLEAVPAEAADAEELPFHLLGHMTLAPATPAGSGAPRHKIVDGQQGFLALCLMLAAARKSLLQATYLFELVGASGSPSREAAEQIKQLLVQGGTILEPLPDQQGVHIIQGLPDQMRVQLATEEDTAFLRRLLLEPECGRPAEELVGEMQRSLWKCTQLFCAKLDALSLRRLLLLVKFILTRIVAAVDILPATEPASKQAMPPLEWEQEREQEQAPTVSKPSASPSPCLDFLPDGSEQLATSADLLITLDGCQLPLHSAVLAAGSRALRTGLCSAGTASATAAAVQEALEGHALADVQLFLSLLYSGGAAAEGACEARLLELLGCNKYWWAEWLLLADRYGLHRLKPVAAERALTDLLSLPDSATRQAMLRKMRGLSAGTYQVLFEAMVEGVVEAGPLKGK
ncbi:hypothetical protein ABPG75_000098 [Micractinium tetrahymenae]